ncbi:MAG: glycosyltransferase family 4 protein [Microthrixaceae bacterium]
MKITFFAINYAPSVGGAQQLVQQIAEGLVHRHGHQVTVITTDALFAPSGKNPGKIPVAEEVIAGVQVLRLPISRRTHDLLRTLRRIGARFGRPIRPSVVAYGPWGLKLLLAASAAASTSDVVIGVSAPFTTLPAAFKLTRRKSTVFFALPILHLGEWVPSGSVLKALRRADRCISLTAAEQSWVEAQGVPAEISRVIPPGCNLSDLTMKQSTARAELGLAQGKTIVFIGRLAAHKGIDTLLAACPELFAAHPDLTVVLAGSRTGWSGLQPAIAELGEELAQRVVVVENFSDTDRACILGSADVVVVPSSEEAFGLVILEAWSASRPVVASNIAAIASVVRHGVDGLLVEVGQPAELALAVGSLLNNPEAAEQMAAAGHERIGREFSWEVVIDRWHEELIAMGLN